MAGRLAGRKHMRMSGYAARVISVGWTADCRWLATSGALQRAIRDGSTLRQRQYFVG
jgi:hypothetical protein